ncbi:MAG: BrnT family toxin [Chloroflexi bacterium]|nr:BrnT family toxin [Chloroflexota bacterium]
MEFEWDPRKAAMNLRKHKVSFIEAATVFKDSFSITTPDPDHSENEDRSIIVGMSDRTRLLIVSFADYGTRIRIISARTLTPTERRMYEEENS